MVGAPGGLPQLARPPIQKSAQHPYTRRYSVEEKAQAVRLVRQLRADLWARKLWLAARCAGHEIGRFTAIAMWRALSLRGPRSRRRR